MKDQKKKIRDNGISNPRRFKAKLNINTEHHDFLTMFDEFVQAFETLEPTNSPNWPRYFILGHALELSLKSFLLFNGYTDIEGKNQNVNKSIKSLGHDLIELTNKCKEYNLFVDEDAMYLIKCLNVVHNNFWSRYPSGVGFRVHRCEDIYNHLQIIFSNIREKIRGSDCRFITKISD